MSYSGVCLKFPCLIAPLLLASTISQGCPYDGHRYFRSRSPPFPLERINYLVKLFFDFRDSKSGGVTLASETEDFMMLIKVFYCGHPLLAVRARKLAAAYIKKMDPDGDGKFTMPDLSEPLIEEEEEKDDVKDHNPEEVQRQNKDEGEGKEPAKTEDVEDVGNSGEVGLENLTSKT